MPNYVYEGKTFTVSGDTKVYVTVEYISDGNTGVTSINASQKTTKQIIDSGTKYIGLAKNLKGSPIIVVSEISNFIPEEDDIIAKFKINDELIVEHSNSKTETERPLIIILISLI